jgi:DNA-binding response OmpR family regulator
MVEKENLMASGRERILIVTGSNALSSTLQRLFTEYGYTTEVVRDESQAVEASRRTLPTLVLVERHGRFEQLRREPALRAIPIVTLQQPEAQCEEEACLDDLDQGADASLCGIGYREVIARVRAILRREELHAMVAELYVVGRLRLDTVRHEVAVDGKPVELTPKEFQILLHLMQHPSKVFSRDELLDRIWGEGYALEQHTLDVHIHSLRHKIEPDPAHPKYILTVRGIGYKLSQQ